MTSGKIESSSVISVFINITLVSIFSFTREIENIVLKLNFTKTLGILFYFLILKYLFNII